MRGIMASDEFDFDELFDSGNSGQVGVVDPGNLDYEEEQLVNMARTRNARLEDFEKVRVLGKGAYGKVYLVYYQPQGKHYAMKVMRKKFLVEKDLVAYSRFECDVLKQMSHPYIVKLYCSFTTEESIHLVMEYVSGGELFYYLRKEALLGVQVARYYISQLVLVLEYLHDECHLIHRDIKPENLLIDRAGHLQVTDFGVSCLCGEHSNTWCGTLAYMAPEMVRGETYDKAVDYWAMGILLYDMLVGHPPFQGKSEQQTKQAILKQKLMIPSYIPSEAAGLIRKLLTRPTAKRLQTIGQIKKHAFFGKSFNWQDTYEVACPLRILEKENSQSNQSCSSSMDSDWSIPKSDPFLGFSWVRPSFVESVLTPTERSIHHELSCKFQSP